METRSRFPRFAQTLAAPYPVVLVTSVSSSFVSDVVLELRRRSSHLKEEGNATSHAYMKATLSNVQRRGRSCN